MSRPFHLTRFEPGTSSLEGLCMVESLHALATKSKTSTFKSKLHTRRKQWIAIETMLSIFFVIFVERPIYHRIFPLIM